MAISKELASRLHDAKFPYRKKRLKSDQVPIPSLAELLTACMPHLKGVHRLDSGSWQATDLTGQRVFTSPDMDEALARLWLACNSPH